MEELEGVLEHITYHSPETGFSVVKLKVRQREDLVVVAGNMAGINIGETLRCTGTWSVHPKFGAQFKSITYQTLLPATIAGIEKYLGSGLIKGVGPRTAQKMVAAFGTDILDILTEAPDRLLEIPRLGRNRVERIKAAWAQQREIQNVMVYLQGHGVSPTFAVKIYKAYGNDAIQVVQDNPYRLAEDIWGIGFRTADRIARAIGLAEDSPERVKAGVMHALGSATEDGHVFLVQEALIQAAQDLLGVPEEAVLAAITVQVTQERIVAEIAADGRTCLYMAPMAYAERGVAGRLRDLAAGSGPVSEDEARDALAAVRARGPVELSDEQETAVLSALTSRLLVLTGGPGTGKSTTCNTILAAFEHLGRSCVLASPTGRAAKRLSEITGRPAQTVHRLLEIDPKTMQFKKGPGDPLRGEVFVFDETSMIDLLLANSLLKALPGGAQVLFVGDADQLPSVGAGAFLRDMLGSDAIPVARLTRIFRQAQASLIVTNAHRINQGASPRLLPPTAQNRDENAFFVEADEPEDAAAAVLDLVTRRLPAKGHGLDDVQVLCPMNRGSVGATALNAAIQAAVNPAVPGKPVVAHGARRFLVGDRVIQLKNNYHQEVFNGDIGRVAAIDTEESVLEVEFPEKMVEYDFSDLDELALAYALSVHKSQGSEYPIVILPVTTQHYPMLQRNLLYTAVTRARRLLIVVGSRKAVAIAVRNDRTAVRNSRLAERLAAGVAALAKA